ncbi:MAG: hypothetical protein QXK06_03740 [Candidatus Diapherotrites archaeon]
MAWKKRAREKRLGQTEKKRERKPCFIKRTGRWVSAKYHAKALKFLSNAIDWSLSEGQINPEKAAELREKISSGNARDFLAGFGAHLALAGIPVITPFFGSMARPVYTVSARARAKFRRSISKTTSAEEYKRSAQLHSVEAMLIGAIPIAGGSAYIVSNFVRDPDLMQVLSNYLAYKTLGKRLYHTFRVRYAVERVTAGAKKYFLIKIFVAGRLEKVVRKPVKPEK